MDGTLTRPTLDFPAIRAAIGVPEPLLENMLALPPGPDRERAFSLLEAFEDEAAELSQLNEGAKELLDFLEARGVPTGLVTRNSRRSVDRTLAKHRLSFSVVMTREDAPAKPRPEALWIILERLKVEPAHAIMVGDFKFDILAGRNAGTRTALLLNGARPAYLEELSPDHLLERLDDLRRLFA
jgi:HAD superfamily hydrolase (TIGR01549 family)